MLQELHKKKELLQVEVSAFCMHLLSLTVLKVKTLTRIKVLQLLKKHARFPAKQFAKIQVLKVLLFVKNCLKRMTQHGDLTQQRENTVIYWREES